MTVKYCDRGFITVNGQRLVDVQNITLKINQNRKQVTSMTRDRFNKGFVEGNIDIDITATVAVQNLLSSPKLEAINYETQNIAIQLEFGTDVWVASKVYLKDSDENAANIGEEVKRVYNFGALEITDQAGNSSLFSL